MKAFVCDGTCAGNELGDCSHYEARRLHPTLRRRAPAKMTRKERFDLAVRAGIYTKSGKLTKHYRDTPENASKYRPTD